MIANVARPVPPRIQVFITFDVNTVARICKMRTDYYKNYLAYTIYIFASTATTKCVTDLD
jgi:hypothetical protein